MKKSIIILLFFTAILSYSISAQKSHSKGGYGKTLNLGLGVGGYSGYYGYVGHSLPVLHLNYEFDVANSFTLAPFISFSTYRDNYWWGDKNHPHAYYHYRETIIPVGVKGTYYFDELLNASSDWDFYLAGSLGFVVRSVSWDNGYYGDKYVYHDGSPLFLDLHVGTEYHFNNRIGAFLDLSTGVSTIGLAFH
jgi:hypothetical protein